MINRNYIWAFLTAANTVLLVLMAVESLNMRSFFKYYLFVFLAILIFVFGYYRVILGNYIKGSLVKLQLFAGNIIIIFLSSTSFFLQDNGFFNLVIGLLVAGTIYRFLTYISDDVPDSVQEPFSLYLTGFTGIFLSAHTLTFLEGVSSIFIFFLFTLFFSTGFIIHYVDRAKKLSVPITLSIILTIFFILATNIEIFVSSKIFTALTIAILGTTMYFLIINYVEKTLTKSIFVRYSSVIIITIFLFLVLRQ